MRDKRRSGDTCLEDRVGGELVLKLRDGLHEGFEPADAHVLQRVQLWHSVHVPPVQLLFPRPIVSPSALIARTPGLFKTQRKKHRLQITRGRPSKPGCWL